MIRVPCNEYEGVVSILVTEEVGAGSPEMDLFFVCSYAEFAGLGWSCLAELELRSVEFLIWLSSKVEAPEAVGTDGEQASASLEFLSGDGEDDRDLTGKAFSHLEFVAITGPAKQKEGGESEGGGGDYE